MTAKDRFTNELGGAPLTSESLQALIAGSENVTPGPWARSAHNVHLVIAVHNGPNERGTTYLDGRHQHSICFVSQEYDKVRFEEQSANAAHIARCDPDTIRSLATELLAAREALEWRPIDTAPKDTWIETLSRPWSAFPSTLAFNTATGRWIEPDAAAPPLGTVEEWQPTHWRHLPALPLSPKEPSHE